MKSKFFQRTIYYIFLIKEVCIILSIYLIYDYKNYISTVLFLCISMIYFSYYYRALSKDWEKSYETILPELVVPRSSTLIYEDNEHCLYNVTLFRKVMEEFKLKAREKK